MLKDKGQVLIGIVYGSTSSSDENNGRLWFAIKCINNFNHYSRVILSSDFNVPGVNWVDFNYLRSELSQAANLFNAIDDAICFIV